MLKRATCLRGVAAAAVIGCAAPTLAAPPSAAAGGDYHAYAEVLQVSPRYGWHAVAEPVRECVRVAEPRRELHGQQHYHGAYVREPVGPSEGSGAATLVGGLVGGLIGSRFGGGDGRTAMTVVGAALGASMARHHVRHSSSTERYLHAEPVRYGYASHGPGSGYRTLHCTDTTRERRVRGIDGYDVTYRYQGATFHKWMNEHPGDAVRVHVAVEPFDHAAR